MNPTTHDRLQLSWTCPWPSKISKICPSCEWPISQYDVYQIITSFDTVLHVFDDCKQAHEKNSVLPVVSGEYMGKSDQDSHEATGESASRMHLHHGSRDS